MSHGLPPLIDLHEDIAFYYAEAGAGERLGGFDEDLEGRQADIPKYRRSNTRLVFAVVFPAIGGARFEPAGGEGARWRPLYVFRGALLSAWEQVRLYYWMARAYGVSLVLGPGDLEELLGDEWRLGFLLHMEGADALSDPWDLELFYRLGLRSIGLTWNHDNRFAASCMTRRDYGLTAEGEELVRLANRLGVVVDLAHASPRAAVEAAMVSSKPVIVSHTGVASVYNTPRNIGDDVLEAVYRSRGVVGIAFLPSLYGKDKPSVDDVVDHVMYIYERYGADIIAIGTDYHGMGGYRGPEGLERIDGISRLYEKLREKGLGDNDLEKIAYRNALRVLQETLG